MVRIAPPAAVLVLVAGALASPVQAAVFRYTGAGGACHPANGASAAKFTRAPHYITNNNTTDQFVVCHLPMDDASSSPNGIGTVELHVWGANAGTTVACVAQTGGFYFGSVHVRSAASRSHTFAAPGESWYLEWMAPALQRDGIGDTLALSCKMGPGTRLGLITRAEGEALP
jgi:hypothetical protein